MILGTANGVIILDSDRTPTLDVSPTYADCVILFGQNDRALDQLGQNWLDVLWSVNTMSRPTIVSEDYGYAAE